MREAAWASGQACTARAQVNTKTSSGSVSRGQTRFATAPCPTSAGDEPVRRTRNTSRERSRSSTLSKPLQSAESEQEALLCLLRLLGRLADALELRLDPLDAALGSALDALPPEELARESIRLVRSLLFATL